MSELQKLLTILDEARHRLIRILYVVLPLFAFFLAFRIQFFRLGGVPFAIPYPYPNLFDNVTAQVFAWLRSDMLPAGVILVNIGIGDSVIAQMEIALLLTFVFSMPWIVHELGAFLSPALRRNEKELLKTLAIPATVLFAVGFLVALLWLTPFTFFLLFRYVAAMGLVPYLSTDSFLTFALLYTVAFGIVFELPVFVYALTRVGLVKSAFWWKHWRGAVMGCFVFGMVITPDNSGITMVLIALPMIALYFSGAYFARRMERQREHRALLAEPA
jgi:sec-independent protein translocase protein TatC